MMVKNKIKWSTVDDTATEARVESEDITLQQQRIRVFKVDYDVAVSAFLQ